ncbi:hypothetical protein [Chitinophaga sancti]|uniref:Uncharacterized protein n=1 Tax=Chitinophaga sancti TaxID=1004 RepID=A0A1K1SRU4_9BACT|nr:hypothetical protein [Chitinophaga sancti]WQD65289.1 hypothetical protein U0033_12880 [Chitinophaga sancti]WQG89087.1 hypothetical protein SR876_29590 [Chitinophaga sancti]SFW87018.1 hypothetical protein SAMN05661012_06016 [Chitinophaga sancti]
MNIEQIKQELLQLKGLKEKEYALGPASKYAYYNPAPKDKDGNVAIGRPFPLVWLLQTIFSVAGVPLILNQYLVPWQCMAISGAVLIVNIILYKFSPKPQRLVVNKNGFTIDDQNYLWDDYVGLYLFYYEYRAEPKVRYAEIVLIKADDTYILVDISRALNGFNYSKIATPLRDFQPAHYKTLR